MPATARSLASRSYSLLTDEAAHAEARVLHRAARAAEDAGDLPGALRLVSGLPDSRASRHWSRQLIDAVSLAPDDLAGRACWMVHPALRWARERPAGAVCESHATLMLKTTGVSPEHRRLRTSAVAWSDPVVLDAALFDTAIFADYLASLPGSLLAMIPEVRLWSAQASLVWQLCALSAHEMVVLDLWDGREVRAKRSPGADAFTEQALLYGRLLPVPGEAGFAFALPPAKVDQRCAARIVRARRQGGGPLERLRAVGHSRRRAIEAGELWP